MLHNSEPPLTGGSQSQPNEAFQGAAQTAVEYDFGRGQVLRYTPPETRLDDVTGEPVIPLLYFQGVNGDDSLPHVMEALGERDKRPVVGIRYTGKLQLTAKPIPPTHEDYDEKSVIPEIEIEHTDDALAALDFLGVEKSDALASSKGGLPMLLAARKRPDAIRNAYADDIAGINNRSPRQTYIDALRLAGHRKVQKILGRSAVQPIVGSIPRSQRSPRSLRDLRIEQKSVAAANLRNVLLEVGANTNVQIRIGSDKGDRGFRTEDVRESLKQNGADRYVQLVENDKGGHGIGTNSLAIDNALKQLREMERTPARSKK